MTSSSGAPPGVQGPTTGKAVTAEQGWNAFTNALAHRLPRSLFYSARARSGLRGLMRSKR